MGVALRGGVRLLCSLHLLRHINVANTLTVVGILYIVSIRGRIANIDICKATERLCQQTCPASKLPDATCWASACCAQAGP